MNPFLFSHHNVFSSPAQWYELCLVSAVEKAEVSPKGSYTPYVDFPWSDLIPSAGLSFTGDQWARTQALPPVPLSPFRLIGLISKYTARVGLRQYFKQLGGISPSALLNVFSFSQQWRCSVFVMCQCLCDVPSVDMDIIDALGFVGAYSPQSHNAVSGVVLGGTLRVHLGSRIKLL
jgi:hypothetical protein